MKRRFRITITPDDTIPTYLKLKDWVQLNFGENFLSDRVRFKCESDFGLKIYCAGIEVFDKTAKAL